MLKVNNTMIKDLKSQTYFITSFLHEKQESTEVT